MQILTKGNVMNVFMINLHLAEGVLITTSELALANFLFCLPVSVRSYLDLDV